MDFVNDTINVGCKMEKKEYILIFRFFPMRVCLFLTAVTENEIIIQISSLKNECASGIDGIFSRVLKLLH